MQSEQTGLLLQGEERAEEWEGEKNEIIEKRLCPSLHFENTNACKNISTEHNTNNTLLKPQDCWKEFTTVNRDKACPDWSGVESLTRDIVCVPPWPGLTVWMFIFSKLHSGKPSSGHRSLRSPRETHC